MAGSAKTGQYGKAYLPFSKLYGDDEAVGTYNLKYIIVASF